MSKTSSADLTGFRETSPGDGLPAPVPANLFPAPGQYPWDDWERMALAAGLSAESASLGRSLMREADQHDWCGRLRRECGWNDEGRSLLGRLLAQPGRTAARLQWLYVTDGLRFDPWEHREYAEDSPCWKWLRAKWDREQATEVRP